MAASASTRSVADSQFASKSSWSQTVSRCADTGAPVDLGTRSVLGQHVDHRTEARGRAARGVSALALRDKNHCRGHASIVPS